jgi:hypothetical protein
VRKVRWGATPGEERRPFWYSVTLGRVVLVLGTQAARIFDGGEPAPVWGGLSAALLKRPLPIADEGLADPFEWEPRRMEGGTDRIQGVHRENEPSRQDLSPDAGA